MRETRVLPRKISDFNILILKKILMILIKSVFFKLNYLRQMQIKSYMFSSFIQALPKRFESKWTNVADCSLRGFADYWPFSVE
jgi:hypothetical protein